MRDRPLRARACAISASMRSAATGSADILGTSARGAMIPPPWRACAWAAPRVQAMALRAAIPPRSSRACRSSRSSASPPKRCATPVMSAISPSGPSGATSGA
ncbi:hypothetical protein [Paracoccus liaowanqingii]|uniref:hypothetical protein n=1 Tax=Paracoccus liaowanqingii TaxID=2560053 RepID=UPI002F3F4C21